MTSDYLGTMLNPMFFEDVTVTITSDNPKVTVLPTTLTFPARLGFYKGFDEQTVTVSAAQDTDEEDYTATLTHDARGAITLEVQPSPATVTVSVTNDDDPAEETVFFSQPVYTVPEGGTVDVTVELNADPERTVTIPITTFSNHAITTNSDYSGVPASVTFNSGETSKTFTFAATQDTVYEEVEEPRRIWASARCPRV